MTFRILTLFGAALLTGCSSRHEAPVAALGEPETVNLYQKGKGLLLPEEVKSMFGLELAEVTEKPMARYWTTTAQVYREARAKEPGAATSLVSPEVRQNLKLGQVVQLQQATGPGPVFTGKLIRLDQKAEAYLGQPEALVEFDGSEKTAPAGTMLTATFLIREANRVIAVPESAVLPCSEGTFVYVMNGQHLTRTAVKIGAHAEGWVEITDGLYAGDMVAVKGMDSLWFIELSALKGGTPCCPVAKK